MDLLHAIDGMLREWCWYHSAGVFSTERSHIEPIHNESSRKSCLAFDVVDYQYPYGFPLRVATIQTDGSLLQIFSYTKSLSEQTDVIAKKLFCLSDPTCLKEFGEYLFEICVSYCYDLKARVIHSNRPILVLLIEDVLQKITKRHSEWQLLHKD